MMVFSSKIVNQKSCCLKNLKYGGTLDPTTLPVQSTYLTSAEKKRNLGNDSGLP